MPLNRSSSGVLSVVFDPADLKAAGINQAAKPLKERVSNELFELIENNKSAAPSSMEGILNTSKKS